MRSKPPAGNFFISFSHEREVQKKREMFLLWQKTFLCKHEHIKDIGQRMLTVRKLEAFIDRNLDELYENRNKNVINLLFDSPLDEAEKAENADYRQLQQSSQNINYERSALAKAGARVRRVSAAALPPKKPSVHSLALNMAALKQQKALQPSPRGGAPLSSDRRSQRSQERAGPTPEEINKAGRKLLRRKDTFGARYHPFRSISQRAAEKSKLKLEMEEYKNKMRYREFLLDLVEKKVKMRRYAQRQKKIDNLRYGDGDLGFEATKQRVERRIEELSSYFTNESNLRNPARELRAICKQLSRIQERLNERPKHRCGSSMKKK